MDSPEDSPHRPSRWQQMFGKSRATEELPPEPAPRPNRTCPASEDSKSILEEAEKVAWTLLSQAHNQSPHVSSDEEDDQVHPHTAVQENDHDDEESDPVAACLRKFQLESQRLVQEALDTPSSSLPGRDYSLKNSELPSSSYSLTRSKEPHADQEAKKTISAWMKVESQAKRIRDKAKDKSHLTLRQQSAREAKALSASNQYPDLVLQKAKKISADIDPRLTMEYRHQKIAQKRQERLKKQREERLAAPAQPKNQPRTKRAVLNKREASRLEENTRAPEEFHDEDEEEENQEDIMKTIQHEIRMHEEERQRYYEQKQAIEEERQRLKQKQQRAVKRFVKARMQRIEIQVFKAWKKRYRKHLARKRIHLKHLKILRQAFLEWKSILLRHERRRKNVAMRQRWVLLNFGWRGWQKFTYQQISERENKRLASILQTQRQRTSKALDFYRSQQFRRHFTRWKNWLKLHQQQQHQLELKKQRQRHVEKILALAREGKLAAFHQNHRNDLADSLDEAEHAEPKAVDEVEVLDKASDILPECTEEKPRDHRPPAISKHTKKSPVQDVKSSHSRSKRVADSKHHIEAKITPMEERRLERAKKRELLKQKYAEAEKKKVKEEVQLAKEQEEKRQQELEDLRKQKLEKKRAEKRREIEKELQREAMIQKIRLARLHYARSLVRKFGLTAFSLLIELKRCKQKKAELWYEDLCMQRYFRLWMSFIAMKKERARAREHRKCLEAYAWHLDRLRCVHFDKWLLLHESYTARYRKAIRHSAYILSRNYFSLWVQFYHDRVILYRKKQHKVTKQLHHRKKKFYLRRWRHACAILREERLDEEDKKLVWEEVQVWLDDL